MKRRLALSALLSFPQVAHPRSEAGSASTTLKAIAYASGVTDSAAATAIYATPVPTISGLSQELRF